MKELIIFALVMIMLLLIDLVEVSKFNALPEHEKIALLDQEKRLEQSKQALRDIQSARLDELALQPFSSVNSLEQGIEWSIAQVTRTTHGAIILSAATVITLFPILTMIIRKHSESF